MKMTPAWKEEKRKRPFPLFPPWLGKIAKNATLPHFHSLGDGWKSSSLQYPLNFNSTKSVTYMTGTFCYRHARPLHKALSTTVEMTKLLNHLFLAVVF